MEKYLILILLVAFAGTFFYLNPQYLPFSFGFSTLSIGTTDFTTNDPNGFLQGKLFVFTVRQGGLAQRAQGAILAEQINVNGVKAKKGFDLMIENTQQECEYPISVDYSGGKIYTYGVVKYRYACTTPWTCKPLSEVLADCQKYGEPLIAFKFPNSFDEGCIYRNPIASYTGRLKEQANYHFKTKMSLAIEGETPITAIISNKSQTTAKFDNVAYAIWQGNLVTGETCPNPSTARVMAVYVKAGEEWRLINMDRYNTYKTREERLNNLITELHSGYNSSATEGYVDSLISQINSAASQALQTTTFKGGFLRNSHSLQDGKYVIELPKQLQFPVFTFYVKADSLGVYTPTVKPKILSAKAVSFKTGEIGSIEVKFKNDSEVGGGFFIWAECPTGFQMYGTTIESYVGAGATKTVFIPLTGSCSKDLTKTCIVHVKGTEVEDTKSVSVTCKPQQVCQPNAIVCILNKIKKCNADGTGYTLISDCAAQGKVCGTDSFGNLTCVNSGTGGGNGGASDSNLFKAILFLAVAVFGTLFLIIIILLLLRKLIGV